MRCRHCGVEIRESMGDMWAGPDNYWTCESVPQDMGGTNHEPGDPFTVGTRVRMARPMTVNGRLSRLTAVGEEGTVMEEHHVNSNDNPAVAHVRWDNGDEWWADRECMDVIGQERPGSSSPRPIPSVNEGRLDINIGTTCERCRSVIQRGERSARFWRAGVVRVRHLTDCQPPPARPRITPPTYNYTYTSGASTYWVPATGSTTSIGRPMPF